MSFEMSNEDQTVTVYDYSSDTGEYVGTREAYVVANTGLPAGCTDMEPPVAPENHVAVFRPESQVWILREDHRGKVVYDKNTGLPLMITTIGSLPDNVTYIAPDGEYMKWDGNEWIDDPAAKLIKLVNQAAQHKTDLLNLADYKISILQDAVTYDLATEQESSMLDSWRKFRVLVNRINENDPQNIIWPETPE
nr:MAG TPA: tail fiber assembly protein [Caudoviricetes sp.]